MKSEERHQINLTEVVRPHQIDELDHFERCPICGQYVDCRLFGDVLHHAEPEHEAVPPN